MRVAKGNQAGEAEGVELIAREQPEVGLWRAHHPWRAVVQQVALVDGLDEELVLLAPALGPRPACGHARGARRRPLELRGGVDERRDQPALLAQQRLQAGESSAAHDPSLDSPTAAKAAAAASIVRSICSELCARDGNHASNCDGGG